MKKILLLASNPKNTSQLRLDEEFREIDNGLQRAQHRSEFHLKQQLAVRPADVRRAMLDFKPNIVHFSGHGAGQEGLAFEDATGNIKLVREEALAGLFELFAGQVECVVLNACYSEIQARAIAQHINHVVGMSSPIGDRAAIEFAVAFYDTLGSGEDIPLAYKIGCNALQWAGIPEDLTPVLISKPDIKSNHLYQNKNDDDQDLIDFELKNLRVSRNNYIRNISDLETQLSISGGNSVEINRRIEFYQQEVKKIQARILKIEQGNSSR
jgi:hypothetical protein